MDKIFESFIEEERLRRLCTNTRYADQERRRIAQEGLPRRRGRPRKIQAPHDLPLVSRDDLRSWTAIGFDACQKTDELLEKSNMDLEQWDINGILYKDHQKSYVLRILHQLQTKIIQVVAERNAELEVINRKIGHKKAGRFKAAVNSRWHQLEALVVNYNSELTRLAGEQYPDLQKLRPLSPKALKEQGLDNAEIWDIEMALCNSDWAVHDFVREGIEATFVLQRVVEEELLLKRQCRRLVRWLKSQITHLIRNLEAPPQFSLPEGYIRVLLVSREKSVNSLLRIKDNNLLPAEEATALRSLHQQIIALSAVTIGCQSGTREPRTSGGGSSDGSSNDGDSTSQRGSEVIDVVDQDEIGSQDSDIAEEVASLLVLYDSQEKAVSDPQPPGEDIADGADICEDPIHNGEDPIYHDENPISCDENPIHHDQNPIHHDEDPSHQ